MLFTKITLEAVADSSPIILAISSSVGCFISTISAALVTSGVGVALATTGCTSVSFFFPQPDTATVSASTPASIKNRFFIIYSLLYLKYPDSKLNFNFLLLQSLYNLSTKVLLISYNFQSYCFP